MPDITGKKVIKQVTVSDVNYSLNAEYLGDLSAAEWKSLVGAGFNVLVVESLPTASEATQKGIYLVAHTHSADSSSDKEIYDEYVTVKSGTSYSWELIGNTDIDISKLAEELVVSGTELTTESAGEQTAIGNATISYMKSAEATGTAGAGVAANTGLSGGATVKDGVFSFSGTEATINLSGTLPTLDEVSVTPAGTITGSASVGDHTHSINPTIKTLTYVSGTANTTGEVSGHTHTVSLATDSVTYVSDVDANTGSEAAHTHSIDASKVTKWSAGSASLSSKNFGFSANTSNIMSAPTVSTDGVLSWTTVNAATQDVLSFTAPSLAYTAVTATGEAGAHSHTIGKATNSFNYATGVVTSVSEEGKHAHSIAAATTAQLDVVTGVSVTGGAGGHTINGSSFKFNGASLTFTPELSTNAVSVSGKYKPAGSITGTIKLPEHSHSYTAPSAHTHSITLATATVTGSASVAVSNHTHSIAAHTHTISKKASGQN